MTTLPYPYLGATRPFASSGSSMMRVPGEEANLKREKEELRLEAQRPKGRATTLLTGSFGLINEPARASRVLLGF